MRDLLEDLLSGRDLSRAESHDLFARLVAGELEPTAIAGVLIALRAKGESPEEIAGAAAALRASAADFPRPDYRFADSCGTGGDGSQTINISTASALVAASLGIPVAKHGNRSISSSCGSADLLERLGVALDPSPATARGCLDEAGICFLFAPSYHPGMRHAMPVRNALGVRTLFNLIGPLVNPAAPPVQVLGVYDPKLCRPMAETLALLGCEAALVVHGSGLDEIALHAETRAARLADGRVEMLELHPSDAGLSRHGLDSLRGGGPAENAAQIEALLAGRGKPAHTDAVALNTGALAWIFGLCPDLKAGTELALEALAEGRAAKTLAQLVELSHGP
jgi:anthranilate phosphoribosyltransferase